MRAARIPSAAVVGQAARLLGISGGGDTRVREAAWIARCVGRGESAPLTQQDLTALAATLHTRRAERGAVLFHGGTPAEGVWIIRHGSAELSVGSGHRRVVVQVLRPGDVDGDIQLLLGIDMPYSARALEETACLFLPQGDFERMLAAHPGIARRWLSSVAERLAASQARIIGLLGRSLPQQVAALLLDEAAGGVVPLPQRTLAAMLGVQRPSLNKVLKDFERDSLITIRYAAVEITDPLMLGRRASVP
jgi:CRP-like cAMP-binding protein